MATSRLAPAFLALLLLAVSVHAATLESETERRADALSIRAQLNKWNEALVAGDFGAATSVFSDDYFANQGIARDAYVEFLRQGGVKYTESIRDNIVIRFYGDTAIVSGQWTSRGTTGEFGSFSSTSQMTDLWVKHDATWECVAVIPDQARQAFARIGQVRLGSDVPAEIVILFGTGVTDAEIEAFRKRHLSKDNESGIEITSYSRPSSIEEHNVVTLTLAVGVNPVERKFFVERMLKDPIVFRIFEDIAPSAITLDE